MNVASLGLRQELYELSKWGDKFETDDIDATLGSWQSSEPPPYDLGYLLRKLPPYIYSEQYEQKAWLWTRKNTKDYNAWYWVNDPKYGEDITSEHGVTAATPEDAACKLAIELFKTNILKREDSHGEK